MSAAHAIASSLPASAGAFSFDRHYRSSPGSVGAPHPAYQQQDHQSHSSASLPTPEQWSGEMDKSFGPNPVFNPGEQSANWRHASTTSECSDWLADKLSDQSAKVIARKSGQNQRSAESVKQGRNAMTMAHLVSMCRADDDFRIAFFQFCGGRLETSPEAVAALTAAMRQIMRQGAGE